MELKSERDSGATQTQAKDTVDDVADATPVSAGDPVATVAAGSVLYSLYKFYAEGDEQGGIFVGLWAPTLLAAATYLQQKDVVQKFKRGVASF